uniref:Albumin domain-containing protein n=1 Tax=Salvator merianae TaxID=96440 RepID=A0A8D0E4F4_SALMN
MHTEITAPTYVFSSIFVLYSQAAQKATFEELRRLTEDVVELTKKCAADGQSDPACNKPLSTALLDELCHEQAFAEKHGFTECCAKADPERNECVLSKKNATSTHFNTLEKQSAEEKCKAYQDDRHQLLGDFFYEFSTSLPFILPSTLLHAGYKYDNVLKTCCQEADKDACFQEKILPVKNYLLYYTGFQTNACFILKNFGERTLKALKVAQLSHKFPKAEFAVISELAEDTVHAHQECCKGDTLECLLDRGHVAEFICTHQDAVSSKVKSCCEKDILDREDCIANTEPDDKPESLSESIKDEFVTNKDVCQHYSHNKTLHLAKFLHEYGRRHQELSYRLILIVTKKYEHSLEECCQHEPAAECLEKGGEESNKLIAEAQEVIKYHCDFQEKKGDYVFQNELLVRFTKKAPQLIFEEVYEFTKNFVELSSKCCKLGEAKGLPCAENYGSIVLEAICQKREDHHLNKQICKCCTDSYASLWDCLTKLGADPEFVPAPYAPELCTYHTDLCSANEKEVGIKKQKLLYNLIKYRPTITKEQVAAVTVDFTSLVTQCCAAENQEECFATELRNRRIQEIKQKYSQAPMVAF